MKVVKSTTLLCGSSTIMVSPAFTVDCPLFGTKYTVCFKILFISRKRNCMRVGSSIDPTSAIFLYIYLYLDNYLIYILLNIY